MRDSHQEVRERSQKTCDAAVAAGCSTGTVLTVALDTFLALPASARAALVAIETRGSDEERAFVARQVGKALLETYGMILEYRRPALKPGDPLPKQDRAGDEPEVAAVDGPSPP